MKFSAAVAAILDSILASALMLRDFLEEVLDAALTAELKFLSSWLFKFFLVLKLSCFT